VIAEPGLDEAAEVLRFDEGRPSVLLTCEHASERLPSPFEWPEGDARLRGTHWAFDLGAADLCRELARELRTTAVLSRFSRLLCDPNRPLDAPDLLRETAEGCAVVLNAAVTEEERRARMELWAGFHAAVDREVRRSPAGTLVSVHTFTPVYEDTQRTVEIGVLFDEEHELALSLTGSFQRDAFLVELNEPYSGKAGLMYSVERHARAHGRRAIEIEVRQDLAVRAAVRRRIIAAVTRCFPS